ncbi:unnamed protein product [Clonostachys rosea]|uniref:Uncharacterized protein n=1 Tax=Bionectria ochroleuca TaxID=29856 RepID=A0ABY6TYM5_BIOOC|nr:unnamed protein product [Clonostachys rosea]
MIATGPITYGALTFFPRAHALHESGDITARYSFQSWLVDHLPRATRIKVRRQRSAINTKGWNQPAGWPNKI